jgi:putative sigma-54 modulation protein
MKINVTGKNITVTDSLKEYVNKKVGKIGKYFEGEVEAKVTLNVENGRHIVEVTIPINSMIIRAETETNDMYSSIDLVVDKLERQIEKYKTKIYRNMRKTPTPIVFKANIDKDKKEDDLDLKVVKVKKFAIKPMDIEEAILQMNLLGHDFFVFLNADTTEVNVVYRRKDGKFGLIEPELM